MQKWILFSLGFLRKSIYNLSLWNDCSYFSFLCLWEKMQEYEVHRDNQECHVCWFFCVTKLDAPIFQLVILRTIVAGWNTALFVVRDNQTSHLVDFVWVTQECVLPSVAAEAQLSVQKWTLIDIFQGSPVIKMSWPASPVWWNGQMTEFNRLPNRKCWECVYLSAVCVLWPLRVSSSTRELSGAELAHSGSWGQHQFWTRHMRTPKCLKNQKWRLFDYKIVS